MNTSCHSRKTCLDQFLNFLLYITNLDFAGKPDKRTLFKTLRVGAIREHHYRTKLLPSNTLDDLTSLFIIPADDICLAFSVAIYIGYHDVIPTNAQQKHCLIKI